MTDGTAGWFRDPNDETLARWHDGKSWTEHTLVIADQPPGVEPPPPQIDPEPEAVTEPDPEPELVLPRRPTAGRGLPSWFKVAGPLAVVALLAVAFTTFSGDDDPAEEAATADTVPASLDDAIRAARRAGLSDEVSDPRAGALIERICRAAEQPTAVDQLGEDLGELPASGPSELRQQVGALGVGAAERCPGDLEDAPDLVDELQEIAVEASATTTVPDVAPDGGLDPGATDGAAAGDGDGGGRGRVGSGIGAGFGGRRSGGSTATTRASGSGDGGSPGTTTATTAAPTTTLPKALRNGPCSSPGATARDTRGTLTCQKACYSDRLVWRSGTCPTTPSPPPPNTGTPPTAVPTSTATTAPTPGP